MKTWHKVVIAGGVAIAALIAIVFWTTSGITKTADDFLAAARDGDHAAAYALTSRGIQEQLSQENLAQYLADNQLDEIVDTSWSSRSISGNTGELTGSVSTENGATLPLELGFVREAGEWRIIRIVPPQAVLGSSTSTGASPTFDIPDDANPAHLMRFHTNLLLEAIEDGEFEYWREFWVEGISTSDLAENFTQPADMVRALQLFENARPVIKDARMVADDQLLVIGRYQVGEDVLMVDMIFVRDGDSWEVGEAGFDLN